MRNAMRYIFILCLFLGFASCQEDVLQPSYKGKGRLVLKDVDISAEASAETVTRATSTFTAPTASELTYKIPIRRPEKWCTTKQESSRL